MTCDDPETEEHEVYVGSKEADKKSRKGHGSPGDCDCPAAEAVGKSTNDWS